MTEQAIYNALFTATTVTAKGARSRLEHEVGGASGSQ